MCKPCDPNRLRWIVNEKERSKKERRNARLSSQDSTSSEFYFSTKTQKIPYPNDKVSGMGGGFEEVPETDPSSVQDVKLTKTKRFFSLGIILKSLFISIGSAGVGYTYRGDSSVDRMPRWRYLEANAGYP